VKFLGSKRKEDFEMIAKRNTEVRGAVNTLYRLSEDPAVRARMEYREKARRDHAALLHAAVEEGEARGEARGKALGKALGRAQGEAQSRAEIARNMKNLGFPPEMIEKATGLGPEAVKQL
jgi:predicted transposase/invertase (TIGR01784 family)